MTFTLIYDSNEEAFVEEKLLPLTGDMITDRKAFSEEDLPEVSTGERLLLYLSDRQIKTILPALVQAKAVFAALPHPQATRFCTIAGVETKMEKAVKHFRDNDTTIRIDLLSCNKRPVFSSVVVGTTFQLATSKFYKSIGFWKRTAGSLKRFFKIRPFRMDIIQKNDSILKTAVSGMVISTHKANSVLSHYIPGESSMNDGMLHALLISPRSIMELTGYAFRSIYHKNRLPSFGAHIRTDKIAFSSPSGELEFTEDGDTHSSKIIELEVKKKHLEIIPGALIEMPEETPKSNEIFKTQSLPSGEAASELSAGKLPFMRRASTDDFKELFKILRENARIKRTYMVLMVLSTLLATLGLFANSSPVVIGAMILAPLMAPIISLSMASLRQDKKLVIDSAYTILAGLGIAFLSAVFITRITPIHTANAEILARTSPNLLDLGIAVVSGIAGAYAHAREEVAKTLAGVAIAVALVPPLAAAGIGLGWLDWNIFFGASLLLFTNLAGMVLAASVTFMFLGFSPFRLATKGVFISLLIVIIFSIPLALGFNQMVYEHKIVQSLDGWQTKNVMLRDVRVQSNNPLSISVVFVTANPLDDDAIDQIKDQIEKRLNTEVELEISIALHR